MNFGEDVQRHLVVFDCNIYLDAARLLGAPFAWDKFDAAVAKLARVPVPHPADKAYDSLRAMAVCTSGRFAGDEALEVWTSSHIDTIVRGKAEQPRTPDLRTGYQGLGWTREAAKTLLDELIHGLVSQSGGGSLGRLFPDGHPPLDHEDGMVYGACRYLSGEDPLARVYCVTRDEGFLKAHRTGQLGDHSRVIPPSAFVGLVRRARAIYSTRRMNLIHKPHGPGQVPGVPRFE